MNYVIIFAGGIGQRMGTTSLPKQFLIVHNKPVIVHTIEKFSKCKEINGIFVVCILEYIDLMKKIVKDYKLEKILKIIPGGKTCQDSIFRGLKELKKIASKTDIVLIHDGVRPLIDEKTVIDNIKCTKSHGSSITVAKSVETVLLVKNNNVKDTIERNQCYLGRAPQSFKFDMIYDLHLKAIKEKKHDFIDSASMMKYYGKKLYVTYGPDINIKVTTPIDFYILKAILDSKETEQIKRI